MAIHNDTGRQGERLAAAFLNERGYTILYANWRFRRWEIDLIATKNNKLHFIEVKTRTSENYGYPEEKMDKKKIRCLIDASQEFLYQYPQWQRIQFDVLSLTLVKGKPPRYFLIEDVYL